VLDFQPGGLAVPFGLLLPDSALQLR